MQALNDFSWLGELEFDYIEDADILELFFVRAAGTDAVELTEDITLRFDRNKQQVVSLIINNYSYLVNPAAH